MQSKECDRQRPDWDEYFMNIAQLVATRSTCNRGIELKYMPPYKGVGAVIVRDKVILATGYNGSPKGLEHCDDVGHEMVEGHCIRTVHAEANALAAAAKNGVAIDGATVYITASPCYDCFKLMVNAGVKRIVCGAFYGSRYGASEKVLSLASLAGIKFDFAKEEVVSSKTSTSGSLKLKIKKLHNSAVVPSYLKTGDAGLDLTALEGVVIPPLGRAKIDTGLAFEIPLGYVGLIWDRSGLSSKRGLKNLGGVIDSGYRGSLIVSLANLTEESVTIEKGERIAQILIQPVVVATIEQVDELSDSERGQNGFGSTDVGFVKVEEIIAEKEKELKEDDGSQKGRW